MMLGRGFVIVLCLVTAALSGCIPVIEPAIPVLSGTVSRSGLPVAGAHILASRQFDAQACSDMKVVAVTDDQGRFIFSGEKTLQLAPLGGDPRPHWEVCIEYAGRIWPGSRPVGFGLHAQVELKCDIGIAGATEWNGICR